MTKSMLFFIAVLSVVLGAWPVLAGDERAYADKTTVETFPVFGMIFMHNLCKELSPGLRMCSTADIVRNGGEAFLLGGNNPWVHPSSGLTPTFGAPFWRRR